MTTEMELGKWYDSFLRCPSQCYKRLEHKGVDLILYLRWRWGDPWQGHIIRNAWNEASTLGEDAEWSPDLLDENQLYFEHDQANQAKAALEGLV